MDIVGNGLANMLDIHHNIYKKNLPAFGNYNENKTLKDIKCDLLKIRQQVLVRGLLHTAKWINEMLFCLKDISVETYSCNAFPSPEELDSEADCYFLVKSYFDLKEYDRAAFYAGNSKNYLVQFMHYYAKYLSGEKKKNDDVDDSLILSEDQKCGYLKDLHRDLGRLYNSASSKRISGSLQESVVPFDSWHLWLYGIVLKRLDITKQAIDVLCESVQKEPLNWAAWLELAGLINDREMLSGLKVPSHWMHKFFLAHVYLELQLNNEALEIYTNLKEMGFPQSPYILAKIAICHHNLCDILQGITVFKEFETMDPFCLDNMDIYSNLLYAKEMRVELAHLAHRLVEIDKYRVETCYVIGNYYSLRSQHEKSAEYFERALRLNPHYLAAWTLMGHEYMELKNTNTAIQCYRRAIEVNSRDYRAWYGLGQAYELLKLYSYCIHYYKQAQKLRPNDSRIHVALGVCFEKLDKIEEARKCYLKAHNVGDIEGIALLGLAKLYIRLNEHERASVVYERYLQETEQAGFSEDRAKAYLFLARHFFTKDLLDIAYEYAQKCTLFTETREAGKGLLKELACKKQECGDAGTSVNDSIDSVISGRLRPGILNDPDSTNPNVLSPLNLSYTP